MGGQRIAPAPRGEWAPAAAPREPQEHRCGHCWTPFGKSAIPCPNEPDKTTKENPT